MKNPLSRLWEGWRSKAANPMAWGIIFAVILSVVGWHVLCMAMRPAHMMEMAAEVGSLGRFIGTPAASADGQRVSFFRGTENGDGLFVCELTNGQRRLIYEDAGNRRHAQFDWSPDGKLLAFPTQKNEKDALLIYGEDSGQIETTVFEPVKEFAWLSPSSFVFLKGSELMRVDKYPDSGWGHPHRFSAAPKAPAAQRIATNEITEALLQPPTDSPATNQTNNAKKSAKKQRQHPTRQPGSVATPRPYPPIKDLMGVSSDSVAWTGRNAIWGWNYHAVAPTNIWECSSNKLLACCYSKEAGAFLLRLRDAAGDHLAAFYPDRQRFVDLGIIDNTNASDVLWVNHGKGYAWLLNESGSHSIFVKADCAEGGSVQCIPQDGARTIIAGGNCIYAIAGLEGQPHGIVEYDAVSGAIRYAVPNGARFRYAKNVIPSSGVVTNSLSEIHACRVWLPVNFDSHKKYPLILCQRMRDWDEYAEAAANAGAFYASVERPDFNTPQLQHWTEDVMAAYQLMARNPNIDTNQIYLCGASAETRYLVELLTEEPRLWRGAILTSAVDFPDFSQTRITRLLINCGEADDYNVFNRVKTYQEDAARAGIPVTVAAHGTGHVFISAEANKESTQQFVEFLFE